MLPIFHHPILLLLQQHRRHHLHLLHLILSFSLEPPPTQNRHCPYSQPQPTPWHELHHFRTFRYQPLMHQISVPLKVGRARKPNSPLSSLWSSIVGLIYCRFPFPGIYAYFKCPRALVPSIFVLATDYHFNHTLRL